MLGQDFTRVLNVLRRANVRSWEIFDDGTHALDARKVLQLSRVSRSRGVAFSVHGPICDLNLATLNKRLLPQVIKTMKQSLTLSAALSARTWVLHPGTHGALSWIHRGEDWKVNMNNLRLLQSMGRRLGVEVTIENISAGYAVLERVRDFLRLYREWPDAPRMTLDVGHSHLKNETQQYVAALADRIRHVHVHDNNGDFDTHLAVGSGKIHWKRFFKPLLNSSFDGDIIIESTRGPLSSYRRVRKLLRSLQ